MAWTFIAFTPDEYGRGRYNESCLIVVYDNEWLIDATAEHGYPRNVSILMVM
jgi:hypothetical protein